MVWEFISAFANVRSKQKLFADDSVAKLNRITTVSILIVCALFMTAKGYFANQIECNDESNKITVTKGYVNSICWVKDIYEPESFNSQHPNSGQRFNFYPWLPVITLFLGLCYYFPYLIWKSFLKNNMYQHMPIDINGIVNLLSKSNNLEKKNFNKNIEIAATYLDRCFSLNNFHDCIDDFDDAENCSNHNKLLFKNPKKRMHRIKAKKFAMPLIFKYLFVKCMYLAISIGIFAIIDFIFRFEASFYLFGYKMLHSMYFEKPEYDGQSYLSSLYFPRVVMCDIHSKEDMVNSNVETPYQCVLPANFLNEKIFIVLWLWFCFMVVVNFVSMLKWCYVLILRKIIIKEMLSWPFDYEYKLGVYIDAFVKQYLRTEGFLVLMLIKSNTQDWHCRMIVNMLWKNYVAKLIEGECIHSENESKYTDEFEKSPLSNQTVDCENRRNIAINDISMEITPKAKVISTRNNNDYVVKQSKNIEIPMISDL